MVSRASCDLSLLFSWSHLTGSGLTQLAERMELQRTAAVLGHPDSAVKTQSQVAWQNEVGSQWKESFRVKVITGFRGMKTCFMEKIKFWPRVSTAIDFYST